MRNMRTMLLAVAGGAVAFSAGTAVNPVLSSKVINWAEIQAQTATNSGRSRSILRARTATLDELEAHITTLAPGEDSHAPHRHPQEEILVLREGVIEARIEGRVQRVETGGFVFLASQEEHSVKNVGTTPATYYVMQWRSPGSTPASAPQPAAKP